MVTVQEKNNGQIVVTIPKENASAMNIQGGDEIDWSILSRDALRADITRVRENE